MKAVSAAWETPAGLVCVNATFWLSLGDRLTCLGSSSSSLSSSLSGLVSSVAADMSSSWLTIGTPGGDGPLGVGMVNVGRGIGPPGGTYSSRATFRGFFLRCRLLGFPPPSEVWGSSVALVSCAFSC